MMMVWGSPADFLDLEEAFGAGAAALVDGDDRLLHQVVLGDHALEEARHLVGAAAGAGGDDELHGLGGLPGLGAGRGRRRAMAAAPASDMPHRRLPRPSASRRCPAIFDFAAWFPPPLFACLGCAVFLRSACSTAAAPTEAGTALRPAGPALVREPGDDRPEQQDHAERHDRCPPASSTRRSSGCPGSRAWPAGTIPRPCRPARWRARAAAADSRAC